MPAEVLSRRALNRAVLARQHLLDRQPVTGAGRTGSADPVMAMVRHLGGLQAQAPFPPYYGLLARLDGFQPQDLSGLLLSRDVVRIALMRGTIHLVTADDALAWRPLAQAVRALVPLVQVPPRAVWGKSGLARHTPADVWLGRPLAGCPDRPDLVRRYLAAFGPATVQDVQAWSGLTRLREVVDPMRDRLRVFADEHGRELFDLPDAPRPGPDVPAPARLLPEYDNLILSHDDRTRVMAASDRQRLFRQSNVSPGSVLLDGFVAGMWRLKRARGTATVTVELFRDRVPARDRDAVTAEAARVLALAAPAASPEVRLVTAGSPPPPG